MQKERGNVKHAVSETKRRRDSIEPISSHLDFLKASQSSAYSKASGSRGKDIGLAQFNLQVPAFARDFTPSNIASAEKMNAEVLKIQSISWALQKKLDGI